MVSKKDRRHSGYVTPQATISQNDLERYDMFIRPFYDDWEDCRDGFRDWFRDFKLIKQINKNLRYRMSSELVEKRLKMNRKQRKLLIRRLLMKTKRK